MRKPEQRLWDRMRKHLGGKLYMERLENMVGTGRPDLDLMIDGILVPTELKAVEVWPKRVTSKVLGKTKGLNQEQLNWHMEWHRWGGQSLVIVAVGTKQFFIPGHLHDIINDMPAQRMKCYAGEWLDLPDLLRSLKR